jgi:hypothetical protein
VFGLVDGVDLGDHRTLGLPATETAPRGYLGPNQVIQFANRLSGIRRPPVRVQLQDRAARLICKGICQERRVRRPLNRC